MNNDLISRSGLLAEYDAKGNCDCSGEIYDDTVNLIKAAPAVDAVEVVRCAKCQHWMYQFDNVGLCVVDVPDVEGVQRVGNGFCSYGERRDDET